MAKPKTTERFNWLNFSVKKEEDNYTVKQEQTRKNRKATVTHQIALTIVSVFCIYILLQLLFKDTVDVHPGFLSIVSMVLGFYFGESTAGKE